MSITNWTESFISRPNCQYCTVLKANHKVEDNKITKLICCECSISKGLNCANDGWKL